MDFSVPANQVLPISVKTPDEIFGTEMTLEVSLPAECKDSVVRVTVSDEPEINKGTPFSVILGYEKDPGYLTWKKNVLAFSDAMPQNSHAEATPADKDVIPRPSTTPTTSPNATASTSKSNTIATIASSPTRFSTPPRASNSTKPGTTCSAPSITTTRSLTLSTISSSST